jgi:hypothetical protein
MALMRITCFAPEGAAWCLVERACCLAWLPQRTTGVLVTTPAFCIILVPVRDMLAAFCGCRARAGSYV